MKRIEGKAIFEFNITSDDLDEAFEREDQDFIDEEIEKIESLLPDDVDYDVEAKNGEIKITITQECSGSYYPATWGYDGGDPEEYDINPKYEADDIESILSDNGYYAACMQDELEIEY